MVLILAAGGLLAAPHAGAQVCPPGFESGHHVIRYPVSGSTREELEESLNRGAPTGPHGGVFYGLTEWCVRWDFVPWKRKDRCELIHISTLLRTKVTLPEWVDSEAAPASLKQWWAVFSKVLEEHENVHVESGRAAEAAIAKAIAAVEPGPSCVVTASRANRIAEELTWQHLARDREYDRETRHGFVQLEEALAEQ